MKTKFLHCCIRFAILLMLGAGNCVNAQIITTIAGNGTGGYSGDGGPATAAELYTPMSVAVDGAGNVFIGDADNNRIRKVTSSGAISTIAGNGTAGYSGDGGAATAAELHGTSGVAVDGSGNLYIADQVNIRIRKVTPSGTISTIAGNGTAGYSGDGGAATAAELDIPYAVGVDGGGNVYIADYNNQCIRKVTPSGIISTFAGNGIAGFSGDGGAATAAKLNRPAGVAIDSSGNVYIADYGNECIRKVTPSGTISTIAGNGYIGFSGDGGAATAAEFNGPNAIAVDGNGNVYISDNSNSRIRKVTTSGTIYTIAGNGTAGYGGDGGAATAAEIYYQEGIAADGSGIVYIADQFNYRIRKVGSCTLPHAAAISGTDSLCPGLTSTFTDATSGGTWISANTAIATVNSSGLVSSLMPGAVNILYVVTTTCGSDTAVFPLVVKSVTACPDAVTMLNNTQETSFNLYPNPNSGTITINLTSPGNEEMNIVITNIFGEKVKELTSGTNKETQIQLGVAPGVYVVTVTTGGERWVRKVIVE